MKWPRVRLNKILSLEYGKSLPAQERDKNGSFIVAGSNGIDGYHSQAIVTGPGIVVGRKGSAGKVTWYDNDFWPIDTTYYVKTKIKLEIRWLFYILGQIKLSDFINVTGVPGLNRNDVYHIEIPLPPLSEQHRIVEILDQADMLRKKRQEALKKADRIIPALFYKMFGDPVMNPMGWPCKTIGELVLKISDGPFGSNLKSLHYTETGIRVIRLQNIGIGEFLDDDKAYISEEHFNELNRHECQPGDVLVGTMGDPNLRACIQPEWLQIALNKADCVQIRPNECIANAQYICALLNQPATERMAQYLILGQTRSRISMGRLRSLEVPVPSIEIQCEFARKIDIVEKLKTVIPASLVKLDTLFSTLLHRAFSGELTAQWREAHMKELLAEIEAQTKALDEIKAE
ncbi:MAG: restriction endonuclease subunit S [Candidatus Xenobiia bacterium LiM19]